MKKVDVIVVGQGIAGTLLAHDLIEARQSVAIIDVNLKASATRVAAGLINPVGMKRCIPSHNAHQYFPKAIERYREIEQKLDTNFLEVKSILRLFANQEVKHDWQIKFSNTNMDSIFPDSSRIIHIHFLMTMTVVLKFIHRRTLIYQLFWISLENISNLSAYY